MSKKKTDIVLEPIFEAPSMNLLPEDDVVFPPDPIFKEVEDSKADKFNRNPDGSVNWRKMINPEFVVLNRQDKKEEMERVYGKPIDELEIDKVDDKYKLILLPGIKQLAKLRGYKSVRYPSITAEPSFVSVYCEIEWRPFEGVDSEIFGDGADATLENTFSFSKDYLTAIAFNRAFVRTVRNYLGIQLVGQDEIGPKMDQKRADKDKIGPHAAIQERIDKGGRTFDQFKNWWISEGNKEAENWTKVKDISNNDVWDVIKALRDYEEKHKSTKSAS